jgi:hypothetical protein
VRWEREKRQRYIEWLLARNNRGSQCGRSERENNYTCVAWLVRTKAQRVYCGNEDRGKDVLSCLPCHSRVPEFGQTERRRN